ncbi:hypothetical protein [Dactylosporangium sp. CA-233914]|uniref:hypothetical protein n=1 Tax=Dactylosporangium sp. CA-233914 TaxID=3239934 RepID=UPI003D8CC997
MDEDAGFDIVPVAIDRYAHHPAVGAEAEARLIVRLLGEHLHSTARWRDGDERTETDAKAQLRIWDARGPAS